MNVGLLAGIELRDSDRIEIEGVVIRLGQPENGFVAPREPAGLVGAVAVDPDQFVSQFEPGVDQQRMELELEWCHRCTVNVGSDLPADAPARPRLRVQRLQQLPIGLEIRVHLTSCLIGLADVVRRRRKRQLDRIVGEVGDGSKAVALEEIVVGSLYRYGIAGHATKIGRVEKGMGYLRCASLGRSPQTTRRVRPTAPLRGAPGHHLTARKNRELMQLKSVE